MKPKRARPPLNEEQLKEMALRYVGRFATSRAKLRAYLTRKIRERGWADAGEPDLTASPSALPTAAMSTMPLSRWERRAP